MSKLYKGIIFNSTTVRALRGTLAEAVRTNHIRTAVVSNHSRTEVQEALEAATPGMEIPREWAEKAFKMLKPDLKAILVDFDGIWTRSKKNHQIR